MKESRAKRRQRRRFRGRGRTWRRRIKKSSRGGGVREISTTQAATTQERDILIPPGSCIMLNFDKYCHVSGSPAILTIKAATVVLVGVGPIILPPGETAIFPAGTVLSIPSGTARGPNKIIFNPGSTHQTSFPSGTNILFGSPSAFLMGKEVTSLKHGVRLEVDWEVPMGTQLLLPSDQPLIIGNGGLWLTRDIVFPGDILLEGPVLTNDVTAVPPDRDISIPPGAPSGFFWGIPVNLSPLIEDIYFPLGPSILPGTILPPRTWFATGTTLPSGMKISAGTAIPSGTKLPPETLLPGETLLSAGTFVPAGTKVPSWVKIPGAEEDE